MSTKINIEIHESVYASTNRNKFIYFFKCNIYKKKFILTSEVFYIYEAFNILIYYDILIQL